MTQPHSHLQLDGTGMKRLHREWRRRTGRRLALILDGVQGPFNVGAIIRTAAALRAEHLWLAGAAARPGDPKVAKTALGTDRYLPWTVVDRGVDAVSAAQEQGFEVVAVELAQGAVPLHELWLGTATCLVVGHEDRGIPAATLAACDAVAYLPQLGKVGSLNVATAASIACYEVRRQAWTGHETAATNPGSEA
jgi:tRNA (guanosine-2'-O-)-methyltransferase